MRSLRRFLVMTVVQTSENRGCGWVRKMLKPSKPRQSTRAWKGKKIYIYIYIISGLLFLRGAVSYLCTL